MYDDYFKHPSPKQRLFFTFPKLSFFNEAINLSADIKVLSIAVSFGTITIDSFLMLPLSISSVEIFMPSRSRLVVSGSISRSFLSMFLYTRTGLAFACLKFEYGIFMKYIFPTICYSPRHHSHGYSAQWQFCQSGLSLCRSNSSTHHQCL